MNTTTTELLSPQLNSSVQQRLISRFSNFSRVLMATACASLVSFAAVPEAHAGKVNGSYEIKSVSGSLKFDGEKVDIPDRLIKRIVGAKNGEISISNRKLRIDKETTVDIVEEYSIDYLFDVEASVTGPGFVRLENDGDSFSGKTSSKIVTKFEASILNEDFSGVLKTKVSATVEKKSLKIVIKYYGKSEGDDFSGRVVIRAER